MTRTQKTVTGILASLALIAIVTLFVLPLCYQQSPLEIVKEPTEYVLRAKVVSIGEEEADLVICVDSDGDEWEFYQENDDWNKGDFVLLMMNSQATETIYDDEIVSVRLDPFAY